jgi:transcriptional regulator with XRE-family HTH domain
VPNDLDGILDAVGPRLRALRTERRVSLSDLAAATGISSSGPQGERAHLAVRAR